jgi:hypothetical protein
MFYAVVGRSAIFWNKYETLSLFVVVGGVVV